ncbi:hypothetical protein O3M35_008576 [Rhynocoris fuscipes]|uniref:Uncharacterized protein n=1 Tax=Rhynocoris fuscipes TaxID=488301 RepID=A0AAW1DC10_9HEMI
MGTQMEQPSIPLNFRSAKRFTKEALYGKMNREYLGKVGGKQWAALCKPDGQIPTRYFYVSEKLLEPEIVD